MMGGNFMDGLVPGLLIIGGLCGAAIVGFLWLAVWFFS